MSMQQGFEAERTKHK